LPTPIAGPQGSRSVDGRSSYRPKAHNAESDRHADGKGRERTCDTAQSGVERDRYEKKYTDAFGDHPTGQL
jgi:hypothetical protein